MSEKVWKIFSWFKKKISTLVIQNVKKKLSLTLVVVPA
jgi:hypothetical protein